MKAQTTKEIINILSKNFPSTPALEFSTPFELLIAVMLSAQCTDERVNKVTKKLFANYNTPKKMLSLTTEELEQYIFSCGLYRSKAKHILSACKDVVEKFNGSVPNNLTDLQSLDGVGRKTANVVYSVAFNGDAIAVDTHVFRVSNRIGLAKSQSVLQTEKDLMKNVEKKEWKNAHHYLIYLGRSYCKAQKPDCENCPISSLCEKNIKR